MGHLEVNPPNGKAAKGNDGVCCWIPRDGDEPERLLGSCTLTFCPSWRQEWHLLFSSLQAFLPITMINQRLLTVASVPSASSLSTCRHIPAKPMDLHIPTLLKHSLTWSLPTTGKSLAPDCSTHLLDPRFLEAVLASEDKADKAFSTFSMSCATRFHSAVGPHFPWPSCCHL